MSFHYPKSAMKVKHRLSEFIREEKEYRELKEGRRILIGDIHNDIAEYCDISFHTVKQIKKGMMIPSIEVALKISSYFNVNVEEIFFLSE